MTKKRTVQIVAFAILLVLLSGLLVACGGEKVAQYSETTDNYRTFYQIFPYSFADSDGDGVGDLQGIIAKLDYIKELNFDGIWLTPVHESPSYHKYDVIDYKSIDSKFGTMDDYDQLVEECHKRGISIILDLVINHTSSEHVWFKRFTAAHNGNAGYKQYYDYYNWKSAPAGQSVDQPWYKVNNNKNLTWAYEGQFWSGMPDLNWGEVLEHPDGNLAQDLEEVIRYWLVDRKIDGFRLDAAHEFFSNDDDSSIEALKWVKEVATKYKPDVYIVGEGPWGSGAYDFYESGIDFFLFSQGYAAHNNISMAARMEDVSYFTAIDKENKKKIGSDGIPALFVANHDTPRAYGILQGGVDVNNMKLGYGVMAMSAGTTYWYYGDEVGMNVFPKTPGDNESIIDEHKRQPMPWGDSYTCKPVFGTANVADSIKYPYGDVATNLKDKNSLVNYIARANALRRAFPQIARNYGTVVYMSDDDTYAIIQKGTGSDAIYIVANLSHMFEAKIDLSTFDLGSVKLGGTLSVAVNSTPVLKGSGLTMPPMTFAVLQKV